MKLAWTDEGWDVTKGKMKDRWPELAEENFDLMRGAPDMLVGRLQEYYGLTHEEAQRKAGDFFHEHQMATV
jgi:uncharacterized protein YjbJ (UPF0337 family)